MAESLIASLIIPMRNEGKYIRKCLESLLSNDFPRDQYEIIVVDGDSIDNSREVVLEIAVQFSRILLLRNSKRVVPPGMNLAIRQALGRYIIRIDAHSEYPPDYIRNCIDELVRTGAANVGGRLITRPGANTKVAKAIALITQNPVCVGNAAYRLGGGGCYVDTVPFGAFPREIFEQVGLFREDLVRHQDYELNARIRNAGGRIYLSPRIYNAYYNVPTFAKFIRQAYMNGLWVARAWVRYPVSFCCRHAAPFALVFGCALLALLSFFYTAAAWVLVAAMLLYFGALFLAGWSIARHHGARFFWLAPTLIFCYHCVYGIAGLPGLLSGPVSRHQADGEGQSETGVS